MLTANHDPLARAVRDGLEFEEGDVNPINAGPVDPTHLASVGALLACIRQGHPDGCDCHGPHHFALEW